MFTIREVVFGNGQPKLCVSLVAATAEQLIEQAQKASESPAEVVEWRYDYFTGTDNPKAFIECLVTLRKVLGDKLLLFTFRSCEEGGHKEISLHEYAELCLQMARTKVIDLIDIELSKAEFLGRQFIQSLKEEHVWVVMSSHNFRETPHQSTLIFQVGLMSQLGADLGKIATVPQELADVFRVMALPEKARGFYSLPLATMAMGALGKISRVSGSLTGSELTFAALESAVAPGQMPVTAMAEMLNYLDVSGEC